MPHATTHAVIPCGGRGTRMLALTGGQPKEMLRVGDMPLVEHAARECAASGITDVLVVIAPGKEAIRAHLEPLAGVTGMPARIAFAAQEKPRGLADAIRLARGFSGDGAIAVVLPDNLFSGPSPALGHVLALARRLGKSAVAMVAITAEDAARSGATAVYQGVVREDEFRITHIPDKGAKGRTFDTGGAAAAYTGVGRYAFGHELWSAIDEVGSVLPADVELDDIPVMQLLLHRGQLTGCLLRERFFDVGLPSGYADAAALHAVA